MRGRGRLLLAVPLAWMAACTASHPDTMDPPADASVVDPGRTGDMSCSPALASDFCPPPPDEMACWGPGNGCGVTPSDEAHAACPGAPPCNIKSPIPGIVWPGPLRDVECGRGFGTPWCFTPCDVNAKVCPCHIGMDLSMRPGAPIYAIYDGVIAYIAGGAGSGLGHVAVVRHDIPGVGVVSSVYWHIAEVAKAVGDPVCAGERLGFLVQFQCSSQAQSMIRTHFHFAVWMGEPNTDPPFYITTAPSMPPPDTVCGIPQEGGTPPPLFPGQFIDPMCLLRDASPAPDTCVY